MYTKICITSTTRDTVQGQGQGGEEGDRGALEEGEGKSNDGGNDRTKSNESAPTDGGGDGQKHLYLKDTLATHLLWSNIKFWEQVSPIVATALILSFFLSLYVL